MLQGVANIRTSFSCTRHTPANTPGPPLGQEANHESRRTDQRAPIAQTDLALSSKRLIRDRCLLVVPGPRRCARGSRREPQRGRGGGLLEAHHVAVVALLGRRSGQDRTARARHGLSRWPRWRIAAVMRRMPTPKVSRATTAPIEQMQLPQEIVPVVHVRGRPAKRGGLRLRVAM